MTQADMLSINTVAAKLGLSVHQLRRWELMFGLEIKRGRGQQRQYRSEDLSVLERIKELVEQGWPTSQIRPQLEAEGLITPKLIGVPQQPGNPEMLMEAIIGLRSFSERRFIEISKQIDELRQLMISITLRNELRNEITSPWQPVEEEFAPAPVSLPPQEITLGPAVNVSMPETEYSMPAASAMVAPPAPPPPVMPIYDETEEEEEELPEPPMLSTPASLPTPPPAPAPSIVAEPVRAKASAPQLDEVTDQNYLTVLGKALDMIGWSDEQADQYSQGTFGVPHWDELGRSQAEKLISFLVEQMKSNSDSAAV